MVSSIKLAACIVGLYSGIAYIKGCMYSGAACIVGCMYSGAACIVGLHVGL